MLEAGNSEIALIQDELKAILS